MRKLGFILALLMLAPALRAAEPENFLLLLDTSRALSKQSRVLQQTVVELVNTGVHGRMQRGDRLIVWTFNEKILPAKIPVQVWTPESRRAVALATVSYVEKLSFEKTARLEAAFPELLDRIKSTEHATVIVVSDGGAVIFGTPFDRELNVFYGKHFDQFKKAGWLFVSSFLVRRGVPEAWAVNASGDRIVLPEKEAAQPVAPPPVASAPPAVEKTLPPEPARKIEMVKETPSGAVATFTVLPAGAKSEPPKAELPKTPPPVPPPAAPVTTTAATTAPAAGEIGKAAFQPIPATVEQKAATATTSPNPPMVAEKPPASLSQKSSAAAPPAAETPAVALAKLDAAPANLESSRPQVEAPATPPAAEKPVIAPAAARPVERTAQVIPPVPVQVKSESTLPAKAAGNSAPSEGRAGQVPEKVSEREANESRVARPAEAAPSAKPTPAQTAVVTPPERRSGWLLALGLGLLAVAGGGIYFLLRSRATPRPSLISRSMRRDRR
ncbi:MAG: hypothetical protein HZA89_14980 [Verrucomicrobia bacterium]|nr:hypothetical protein [Verrucomicrobiota bacterium]